MPYLPREDKGFGLTTSYREFEALRARTTVFAGSFVASRGSSGFRLSVGSDAESSSEQDVKLQRVSHEFFSTLGVVPVLGRTFTEVEDRVGEPMVAIISHSFWDRRFGRDPMVIGRQVIVTDFRDTKTPATIIGVVQPDFVGTNVGVNVDVWMPLQGRINPQPPTLLGWWGGYEMMTRLRPGVSLQQAQAEVDRVYGRLLEEWRGEYGAQWTATQVGKFVEQRFRLEPGAWGWSSLRAEFKQRLTVLMASVGSVLLVACINIAAFLLARGSFRQREFAVRRAVGSGRARLIRQLMTESVALASIGGVIALFVAHWSLRLLIGYTPALGGLSVSLDMRVVGFAAVLTLLSAILFGLVPAIRATRPDLNPTLKSGRNNFATERPHLALNQILVASQIAVSLILLVAAGLLVRTLQNLRALDPGFDKREIVLVELNRPLEMARLIQILARIEGSPVVESSTVWEYGMLGEGGMSIGPIHVNGHVPDPNEDLTAAATYVGPRFFETSGISLIAGRGFTPEDSLGSRVAVVSATMARHYFG
jgi:predicted permease